MNTTTTTHNIRIRHPFATATIAAPAGARVDDIHRAAVEAIEAAGWTPLQAEHPSDALGETGLDGYTTWGRKVAHVTLRIR
jgi:hypothetical protein